MKNLTSPQLRQALDALTSAMRQNPENVEMILMMCDLDASFLQVANGDGIEAFIKALIHKNSKKE